MGAFLFSFWPQGLSIHLKVRINDLVWELPEYKIFYDFYSTKAVVTTKKLRHQTIYLNVFYGTWWSILLKSIKLLQEWDQLSAKMVAEACRRGFQPSLQTLCVIAKDVSSLKREWSWLNEKAQSVGNSKSFHSSMNLAQIPLLPLKFLL